MKSTRAISPEVSVVVAVRNDEDLIGKAMRRLVEHMRELRQPFEVVAVNDGSWDTSFAVLKLLATEVPELRLSQGNVRGRAFLRGVSESRGGTVVLLDSERLPGCSFSALGWTLSRLAAEKEAVVVRGRWIGARRLPAIAAIARARGRSEVFERSFEREARGLTLEVVGTARRSPRGLLAPVLRFLAA
jgi:glycosyltransferase involved in cell wall biosynthesis